MATYALGTVTTTMTARKDCSACQTTPKRTHSLIERRACNLAALHKQTKQCQQARAELTLHQFVNVLATIHEAMALARVHVQGNIFVAACLHLLNELLHCLYVT